MALSKSVFGAVRTPRLYVDYIQYAKAIGWVKSYGLTNLDANEGSVANSVWDFNPVNYNSYTTNAADDEDCGFDVTFKNDDNANKQFGLFLGSLNYYGILNHRLGLQVTNLQKTRLIGRDLDYNSSYSHGTGNQTEIVGDPEDINHIGYSLYETDHFAGTMLNKLRLNLYSGAGGTYLTQGEEINIGAVTIGKYFDFPHSANLSMNINYDSEGIKTKRTIGGSDLTDITYLKPKWGDLNHWTHIDLANYDNNEDVYTDEDYSPVTYQGRRSWDLTFSFLSKSDTFTKNMEKNMSGIYNKANIDGYFDLPVITASARNNIIGNFLTFTLNGQIPFLFQPDNTKQDFVIAKLRSNSLSIQQSAPDLYTAMMSFEEVW